MFINDVNKREEIRNIAVQHLRKYGIKYRPKKGRPPPQGARYGKKFFKVPLINLETETVTLSNGQQLIIPKRIHEMCSYVLSKVQTEGIFRKEGSKSRQNEIKLLLDRGCPLGDEHHVIDVAVVLKCFLRELPEPLIPHGFHELFLRCSILDKKLEALLLSCLLLPCENLNVLSYLMQFFYEVASYSSYNKMCYGNLAILLGPNIFPIDDKIVPKSSLMITKICDITKLLIENSRNIGFIPDDIIEQVGQLNELEQEKRRKNKRRSGSLTRMLNGLKKMVSSRNEEATPVNGLVTPDLLTPTIHSVKKRKADGGLSLRKKKEVLTKLPDCALLNTPFTPSRTPVSANPNGMKVGESLGTDQESESQKEKKMHWYMRSKSMKSLKEEEAPSTRRNSLGPKSLLERRWSAVSNAANFRKKKRNSCAATKKEILMCHKKMALKEEEADYIRVPKVEYEEFKSRISAIERRISLELEQVQSNDNENNINQELDSNIENVQTAYQKTLEAASLSPTTDQLARRLSRDLRIRRSAESKVIRSPSARKIGSIRRRSSEREKKGAQVSRNQSWHVGTASLIPRATVTRNKAEVAPPEDSPPYSTPIVQRASTLPKRSLSLRKKSPYTFTVNASTLPQSSPQCAVAVNISDAGSYNNSGTSTDHWVSAEGYFTEAQTPQEVASANARASIAKLRSQNVGMVRAKARLFDTLKDSDSSSSGQVSSIKSQPNSTNKRNHHHPKTNPVRSGDATRMSYRIRTLRSEEKKYKKSNVSPRRRHVNSSEKKRLQALGKQYVKCYKENIPTNVAQSAMELTTPRRDLNTIDKAISSPRSVCNQNVPIIKMPLTVKTPKRLCRTPGVDRKTPFRVIATPM
ncbi:uncharacterized protein LOC143201564 isoform X1 [Rhynchophorus ferrugineus]|uniref:Rho-GAP domain-containing protein n=1 Tax=Rhynchophorus ferrugineus TaxID=354439 RepID=A0A834I5W4_RHYFE|nr:hypothetical protein GWI33_014552 [Rhynchophorus ferrugineus]